MPIIITGMHRSGTSLTAAIVRELGVFLGANQELMSAAADNPDGFYERWDVVRLNDALLKRAGGNWHEPPAAGPDFWQQGLQEPLRQLQDHAVRIISRLQGQSEEWAIKDPRFSLTLSFWQTLIPDARYLICLRDPRDVARSLKEREGFDPAQTLALWHTCYQWLDAGVPAENRLVIDYDDLLERGGPTIVRLRDWLGLPADEAALAAAVGRIKPGLRHHHRSTTPDSVCFDPPLAANLAHLYQAWKAEARFEAAADTGEWWVRPAATAGERVALPPADCPGQEMAIEPPSEPAPNPPPFHALGACLDDIRSLNAFTAGQVLPAYQVRILEHGHLSVVSPFDGQPVQNHDSLYLPGNKIVYCFVTNDVPFQLITGDIQFGYPLTWLLCPLHRVLIRLAEGSTGASPDQDAFNLWMEKINLALAERGPQPPSVDEPGRVVITLGHRNFAHHLWNELSALETWLAQTQPSSLQRPVSLVPLREPLGLLENVLPELAMLDIRRADVSPRTINRIPGCLVPLGGRKIGTRIQERLTGYLARVSGPLARTIEQDFIRQHSPLFWISVRTHDRTCTNQEEFLATLAARLLQAYPGSGILLDGFAFSPGETDLETILATEQRGLAVAEAIQAIQQRIAREHPAENPQRVLSVSGLSLLDNLYLARFVDYYICHAGTLQHKLGWLYPVPGFIHTTVKDDNACRAIESWYAHQVDNGRKPVVLPARYISRLAETSPGQPDRNRNYRIDDLPGAIDFILQDCATILNGSDTPPVDTLPPAFEYRHLHTAQVIGLTPPPRLDGRQPPHPRLTLKTARMPDTGVALIPDGKARLELPCQFFTAQGQEISELMNPTAPPPVTEPEWHRLPGRVCPVIVQGGGIFAHWLGDVLPALHLVELAGIDLDSIDYWILNRNDLPYHRESLQKLGIPPGKVMPWSRELRFIQADELIVPTRVRMHLYTAPWIIEWLRHTFMPDWAALTRQSAGLRLYLSRDKASKRQVINEAEVVAMLQEYGFQVLHLETLSITAAARLLAQADTVVAPHGAGLANMVFCKAGTRLLELYSWHISQEYWITAQTLGLNYANLACPGPDGRYHDEIGLDYTQRFAEINSAALSVDCTVLRQYLEEHAPRHTGPTTDRPVAHVDTEQLPPVFIFAACWRTGSTLLQRILNSSDQLMIWGEPGYLDLMRRVYDMLTRQTANQEQVWDTLQKTGFSDQWLPNLAPRREWTREALREFFQRLYFTNATSVKPTCRGWGMKEVRAGAIGNAEFLHRLFPDARFVFLFRHPVSCFESVIASQFYRNFADPLYPMKVYRENLDNVLALRQTPPAYAWHSLRYEDMIGPERTAVLDELFDFIGVSRPPATESVITGRKLGGSHNKVPLTDDLRAQLVALMGDGPAQLGYDLQTGQGAG